MSTKKIKNNILNINIYIILPKMPIYKKMIIYKKF